MNLSEIQEKFPEWLLFKINVHLKRFCTKTNIFPDPNFATSPVENT